MANISSSSFEGDALPFPAINNKHSNVLSSTSYGSITTTACTISRDSQDGSLFISPTVLRSQSPLPLSPLPSQFQSTSQAPTPQSEHISYRSYVEQQWQESQRKYNSNNSKGQGRTSDLETDTDSLTSHDSIDLVMDLTKDMDRVVSESPIVFEDVPIGTTSPTTVSSITDGHSDRDKHHRHLGLRGLIQDDEESPLLCSSTSSKAHKTSMSTQVSTWSRCKQLFTGPWDESMCQWMKQVGTLFFSLTVYVAVTVALYFLLTLLFV